MTKYFSSHTQGFYDSSVNVNIPTDAVAISESAYLSIISDLEVSSGVIHINNQGELSVTPPSEAETLAAARSKRNSLLTASDWTMIPDVPVDQVAWATYRQELRDIPQQAGFPNNITWPVEPEEVL